MSRSLLHSDYVSGSNYGMKNRIINGGMDISQRGTSFAHNTSMYFTDRWCNAYNYGGAGAFTATQSNDVPASNEFQSSLKLTATTAIVPSGTLQYGWIEQRIEGYNSRDLINRTFTLSFWVKSSKTGTHCVSYITASDTNNISYIAEYNIIAANTWEYKTITVSGGMPNNSSMSFNPNSFNWTNGMGIVARFCYTTAGSANRGTAGSWLTGNFGATVNQVNCLDTIGNIFAITGVQLEVGAIATPFEHRPFGMELALCQRYFQLAGNGAIGRWGSATQCELFCRFPVTMRAAPNMASIVAGGNVIEVGITSRNSASLTPAFVSSSITGYGAIIGGFTGATAGSMAAVRDGDLFTASAEL